MSLAAALDAAVATLRRRPADLLPVYLLAAAVPAVARTAAIAGLGVAYAYLEVTGRLDAALSGLARADLEPPDPESAPEAFAAWTDGLAPVVEPLLAPVAVAAVAAGLLLAGALAVLAGAAVVASQLAACDARLRGRRGLPAGVAGVGRYWRPVLGAYLLEAAVWVVASAIALLVVAGASAISPLAALAVGPVAVLGWLLAVLSARAVFAFVPVAVVVDGVGTRAAVRASAGFLRREPVGAAGYFGVALGTLLAFSAVAGLLALLGASAVAGPIALLALAPALDLAKTGLYLGDDLVPPDGTVAGVRTQLAAGLRRGLRAVRRFVGTHPGLHALALGIAVAGGVVGWLATGPLVGAVEASIEARLAGHLPPVAAVTFLANNWTVAASTALSGLALGLPAAASLWLNGVLLGAVAHLEVAPLRLLAFVLPHGVVEVPAFVVAGALGLHLGVVGWRAWRGRLGPAAVADALARAFWVLVGLAVLLAVAGLVEGFVSPYYWRPFL